MSMTVTAMFSMAGNDFHVFCKWWDGAERHHEEIVVPMNLVRTLPDFSPPSDYVGSPERLLTISEFKKAEELVYNHVASVGGEAEFFKGKGARVLTR